MTADSTLEAALQFLASRGQKLTPLRRLILELLCRQPKAIGAYALLSAVKEVSGRRIAPESVYRTLAFLEERGLVAHLLSTRTYVVCSPPVDEQPSVFFVCRKCGATAQCRDSHVQKAVRLSADAIGFVAPACVIDLTGLCNLCANKVTRTKRKTASYPRAKLAGARTNMPTSR